MNGLRPGCGAPPSDKTMWMSGNTCYLSTCDRVTKCFDVEPGVTDIKACSFATINEDCVLVQVTPANIATIDPAEIWFAPKAMCPVDYCKQREVESHICIECDCVQWCDDATPEFIEAVWKLAGRQQCIECQNQTC